MTTSQVFHLHWKKSRGKCLFIWNTERQRAFDSLKNALLCTPVLRLANVDETFRVETDASDFAVAAVLSQKVDAGSWLPVAYASRKLCSAERNYTAAERETVAIVFARKSWRVYLFQHFDTGNTGVLYLPTKPQLMKREARWVQCYRMS